MCHFLVFSLTGVFGCAEYADESFLVPKNTSVIVRRVPATRPRANLHALRKPEYVMLGLAFGTVR
jgi:hypothetical protein